MSSQLVIWVWNGFHLITKVYNRFLVAPLKKQMLAACGKNVILGTRCNFTWQNVYIGNDVSIGPDALFLCTRAKVHIGDHVMLGPSVTMITGEHRTDVVGRYMKSIADQEKLPDNDQDIVLEGDNWICSHAIILKGVTVGKGSVVAAGAVVACNVPPYTIVGGVPARIIRSRFPENNISKLGMMSDDQKTFDL